MCNLDLM